MHLAKTFCASPWLHMRITNSGQFKYCRWSNKQDSDRDDAIHDVSPITWFQTGSISRIREQLLSGQAVDACSRCYHMERHGKVSGRERQLLKIGVTAEDFAKSMASSSWIPVFEHSKIANGDTDVLPQDWQIDLGNFCNSACIFCDPGSSSRLASEFQRIGLISQLPPANWSDDAELLKKFISVLEQTPRLAYLHFIGGETLITPAFKDILMALIQSGLNRHLSIGFTTNLTRWRPDIVDLLNQFSEINVGMSVECFHPVNDYVRYGSDIHEAEKLLRQWSEFARSHQRCYLQIRTTPTILTVKHLDTVYDKALELNMSVESCNFLERPEFMRATVLPAEYRAPVIARLQSWLERHGSTDAHKVVNVRNPNTVADQLCQDVASYIKYLGEDDESHRLPDLVKYLHMLESSRHNSILHYLPEYEKLFRSAGY